MSLKDFQQEAKKAEVLPLPIGKGAPDTVKPENAPLPAIPVEVLQAYLTEAKISPTEQLQEQPTVLHFINGNGDSCPIASLGDFSLIMGKAKSRKTFFITVALSATTTSGLLMNRYHGTLPEGKKDVLLFDTEQSRYDVQKVVKRVCRLSGLEVPPNFHPYGLRKYPPAVRLAMIEHAIYSNPNTGFVVIDGVRDLVTSINDEEQATMMATHLLRWTEERQIHVMVVLHQNKGDNNARGHLGSELVNKAQTTLSITKSEDDREISIVAPESCRGIEPEQFAFRITEDGLPEIDALWTPKEPKRKQGNKEDIADHALFSIMSACFSKKDKIGYAELWKTAQVHYKTTTGAKLGDNDAKKLIARAQVSGYVEQPGGERTPYLLGKYQ